MANEPRILRAGWRIWFKLFLDFILGAIMTIMNRLKLAWTAACVGALVLSACGEKKLDEPIPDTWAMPKQECPHGTDKSVLAGRWRYLEQGSSYLLNLDGQGNGSYSWKDGRFVSVCLDR